MNVTVESLEKKFKGEGESRFAKIAELGGFGAIGEAQNEISADRSLDLAGVLDPENKAVTEGNKTKIGELLGESKSETKVEKK